MPKLLKFWFLEDLGSFCLTNPIITDGGSINATYNSTNILTDNCEANQPFNYPYPQYR